MRTLATRAIEEATRINAEQHPTVVEWSIPQMNGYPETSRRTASAYGYGVEYLAFGNPVVRMVIWRDDLASPGSVLYEETIRSLYLMDDGKSVRPFYVAGWYVTGSGRSPHMVILSEFPTGPNFRDWSLNPARAFHVKVTGGSEK